MVRVLAPTTRVEQIQNLIAHLLDPSCRVSTSHQKFNFEDSVGGGKLLSTPLEHPKVKQNYKIRSFPPFSPGWEVGSQPQLNVIPQRSSLGSMTFWSF